MRWLVLALLVTACAGARDSAPHERTQTAQRSRQLGVWTGRGSTTLGFVSESGSFRIEWKTRNESEDKPGTFQLTLRSGVSGRPMQVIADQRGAGAGSVDVGDDPRLYEFLVEASGVEWSIAVKETFAPRK